MAGAVTVGKLVIDMSADVGSLKGDMAQAATVVDSSSKQMINSMLGITEATGKTGDAGKRLVASLQEQIKTFGMTNDELLQYKANLLGVGDQAQQYISRLSKMRDTQGAFNVVKEGAEGGAGAMDHLNFSTSQARRELLVLAHEAATGNWSRFGSSLMVLGERIDAMGAIFATLTNPLTYAALAAAGFAFAVHEGTAESEAFNKSLLLTGDYAGITEGQFNSMARSIATSSNSGIGAARAALQTLISSGRLSGDALKSVGDTALEFSRVSGQSADDVIKDFSKMSDGVAKWAEEHNRQYHFLTGAQYEHIATLEKEGDSQRAMQETMDAFNAHLKTQTDNVGYLGMAWNATTHAFSDYWDKMKSVGRDTTIDDQIAAEQSRLVELQNRARLVQGTREGKRLQDSIAGTQGYLSQLQARKDLLETDKRSAALADQLHEKAIQAVKDNKAIADSMRSRQQQADDEIKRYQNDQKAMIADGMTADSADKQLAVIAAIRKKYSEKEVHQKESDYQKLSAILNNKLAEQELELAGDQKLTDGQKLAAKFAVDLRDGTIKLTDAEKQRITATLEAIITDERANKAKQDAAVAAKKAREELVKNTEALAAYENTLSNKLGTAQNAADISVGAIGMGALQAGQAQRLNALQKQYDSEYAKLVKSQKEHPQNNSFYESEISALNAYQEKRIAKELDTDQRLAAARANWANGAEAAYQDYQNQAADVESQVGRAFSDGFKGMEDGLTTFIATGKLSFSSLRDSVVNDIARMEARALESKLFGSAASGGGGGGSLFGNVLSAIGGGWGSWGVANAGVAASTGLSFTDLAGAFAGGGRASGGPVEAGMMYPVNEIGPELLSSGGKDYLMMGSKGGTVIPNNKLGALGSKATQITFAPVIQVDSRTDGAQIQQIVGNAMQTTKAQLIEHLRRERLI